MTNNVKKGADRRDRVNANKATRMRVAQRPSLSVPWPSTGQELLESDLSGSELQDAFGALTLAEQDIYLELGGGYRAEPGATLPAISDR